MMKYLSMKSGINLMLFTGLCLAAHGQKLKSVQEKGVRPPSNIRIDGKLTEWDDTFQAYNPAVSLYYTVANDDNNLYLIVKSTDQTTSNKISSSGITFTINTADKKKEKDAFGVKFPGNSTDIMASMRPQGGPGGGPGGGGFARFDGGGGGRPPGQMPQLDSATLVRVHKSTVDAAKEIKLIGFTSIPDSIVSIYNEYGFKAAIGFDPKNNLTYEVAIPLKSLGLDVNSAKEFSYNIKVNAIQFGGNRDFDRQGPPIGAPGGAPAGFGGGRGGGGFGGGGQGGPPGGGDAFRGPDGGGPPAFVQAMLSSTDFWGKYTLVKN
jgi:hypothetical protein